jgi:hypothetical protein
MHSRKLLVFMPSARIMVLIFTADLTLLFNALEKQGDGLLEAGMSRRSGSTRHEKRPSAGRERDQPPDRLQ